MTTYIMDCDKQLTSCRICGGFSSYAYTVDITIDCYKCESCTEMTAHERRDNISGVLNK
jgi:hypothetical protein